MRREVLVVAPDRGQGGDLGLERVAGLDDLGQPVGVGADGLDDALGSGPAATTVPSPWRTATTPITSSATSAWLRVARLTPRRTASSRSGGSRSPALQAVLGDPGRDLLGHLLVEPGADAAAGAADARAASSHSWHHSIDIRPIVLLARPLSQP